MTRKTSRRLFMRLDLDYADHPKIVNLSDAAFRAHIELIAYARKYLTDGRIPNRIANRFGTEALSELMSNHPQRPSLRQDDDGDYWLHDFTEEQESRAEVEARRLVNARNGARGGRPAKRVANPTETDSVTEPVTESPSEMKAETETETETELLRSSGGVGEGLSDQLPALRVVHSTAEAVPTQKQKRGSRIPEGWMPDRSDANINAEKALTTDQLRLQLDKFRDYWTAKTGQAATKLDWNATWRNWVRTAAERTPTQRPKGRASDLTNADWDAAMAAAVERDRQKGLLP